MEGLKNLYIDKGAVLCIEKGMLANMFEYQPKEVSGKEFKELAGKKASQLQIKLTQLQTVMAEILRDVRVQPNKPIEKYALQDAFLPDDYNLKLYSWELCNYASDTGLDSMSPNVISVPFSDKKPEFEMDIDDFPISDGEMEERMRYNETAREWLSTHGDYMVLKTIAENHDEKKSVTIPYRLFIALQN